MSSQPASGAAGMPRTWKKPPFITNPITRWSLYLGSLTYLVVAISTINVKWDRVWEGLPRGLNFVLSFFPPDFFSRSDDIIEGFVESLSMTGGSTVIGIALSIPIGLGAARNISPMPIYVVCRGIIALSRALPELIVAIFMVTMFGFGPFAGLITLSFATIGFIAKLLAEDIEDIDPDQVESIRATGATWTQMINYAVQPQVVPRLVGLSMYRLDINFRESAIIGIVGAGGIGATLNTAIDRYEFDSAAGILLIIIAIVMLAEYSSSLIRRRMV